MTSETTSPVRRTERVRHELRRRELAVVRNETIGANFSRITFTSESLSDFVSSSFDDHIKCFFPAPSGEVAARDYTPRSYDNAKRELVIEFALHGDGVACQWAKSAKPGDTLNIGGPRSSLVIPSDYEWHLLAGDSTALPAIHRRIEELPAGTRATVLVQVDDAADERAFLSNAALEVKWVRTHEELVAGVAAFELPAGEGFAWCGGEASAMKRIRELLLVDKQHPREAARIAAYWKLGASSHHENLE